MTVWERKSAHTTATQGHSNPHPDITTSFHKKSEKSDAQCLFDLGNFLNEDSILSGGILPRGFDEETRRTGLLLPTRLAEVQGVHFPEASS